MSDNTIIYNMTKHLLSADVIDVLCGYNYPSYLPPGIFSWMENNILVFISLGNKCFLVKIKSINKNICNLKKISEFEQDCPTAIDLKIISPVPFPRNHEIKITYTEEYCQWVINNNKLGSFVYENYNFIILDSICYKLVIFLLKRIVYDGNLMRKLRLQFTYFPMTLRGLITHFVSGWRCNTKYKYLPQFITYGFKFDEEDIAWAYAEEEKNCIEIIFRTRNESIDDKVDDFLIAMQIIC